MNLCFFGVAIIREHKWAHVGACLGSLRCLQSILDHLSISTPVSFGLGPVTLEGMASSASTIQIQFYSLFNRWALPIWVSSSQNRNNVIMNLVSLHHNGEETNHSYCSWHSRDSISYMSLHLSSLTVRNVRIRLWHEVAHWAGLIHASQAPVQRWSGEDAWCANKQSYNCCCAEVCT